LPYPLEKKKWLFVGILTIVMISPAHSKEVQEEDQELTKLELAKLVENPVSDLMRFGLGNNIFFGAGPKNHEIVGLELNAATTRKFGQWSILNRLTIPFTYLPASAPAAPSGDSGARFGLGDIQYTGFLVRDESKRFFKSIGGLGPTIVFNSATDDRMGLGKWSAGPTLAIVRLPDPWVFGVVVRNLWSFAGNSQRERVNRFLLTPFVNYNFSNGWYLVSTPRIRANWEADSGNKWTIPIGGGVGKVLFRGNKHPVNLELQAFYFIEKPDLTPDWVLGMQFRILLPQ